MTARRAIVVMGVAGSGKTGVGEGIAARLGIASIDGDTLHPSANVVKMRAGLPLDDADRAPWLDKVGRVLADRATYPAGVVVACSALRRRYRDRIRAVAGGVRFVHLDLPCPVAVERVAARPDHFMPASLVADQFAVLEPPGVEETDVRTVDATLPLSAVIARALA